MKALLSFILVGLLSLGSVDSVAQFSPSQIKNRLLKRAGDRAAQKVTQKAEQTVDKGVDKVIDGIFGAASKTVNQSSPDSTSTNTKSNPTQTNNSMSQQDAMKMVSGMLGGMGTAPAPNSSYNFSSSYIMNIKSASKDGSYDMKTKYYFTNDGNYVGTKFLGGSDPRMSEGSKAIEAIVMDFDKTAIYTFMNSEGKKTLLSVSLNSSGTEMVNQTMQNNSEQSSFTKTGKTRTIANHLCDGYLLKQNDDESTIWISRNRVPVVSTYYKAFQKASNSGKSKISFDYGGNAEMANFVQEGRAMLGMNSKNPNGEEMVMEVSDIKQSDNYTLSTSGYENLMDFNKIMQDAQNQQENSEN